MADHLGSFNASSTIYFYFTTHAASGAAVAPSTAFEAADLLIYKNGSATQRSSASGITMTSPFDSVVGLHAVAIDLSDNTDASFYAAGSEYVVVLSPDETVDSLAVVKVVAYFSIERVVKVNVTQFGGSAGTFASGRPDVNTTYVGGTAQTARDLGASVLLSSGTGTGQLSLSSGAVLLQATQTGVTIPTVTNLTNAPGAGDFTSTMKTSIGTAVAASAVASVTGAVGSIGAGGITATSIASDAITAAKIADGAIDAATFAAGAINAAAIAADAITDAKVASDVTIASVTGAVGSVTGAVGSVTGAVGSVTGNVGGNVTGSVGSVATGGITAASIAADAIGASELAADAVTEIAAAISIPSAATVAAAVWDLATSGHVTSGTFGAQTKTLLDTVAGYIDTEVAAIKAKTDNLPAAPAATSDIPSAATVAAAVWDLTTSGHSTGGTFGGSLVEAHTQVDQIQTAYDVDGDVYVLTANALKHVFDTALTQGYATDGSAPTLAQFMYMIWANSAEFSISGTTITAKKLDGSTTAMTFTIDDATNPTSRTRAS